MRAVPGFLLRNWPLKVAALVLATLLYGGVVLSENTRTWPGQVPIDVLNPPPNAALLDNLGYVTNIQFRAPLDVASQLSNGSFHASVDLSHVQPQVGAPPVKVPVALYNIDARVQIVDYAPRTVNVRLDQVVTRAFPVTVEHGTVPEALQLGPPQVTPSSVEVTGASSHVASIRQVLAQVTVDQSGLNVDQEVDLRAVDDTGVDVPGVQINPQRAEVRIDVSRQLANAALPVVPQFTGSPTAGYVVTAVTLTPLTVTVSGEAPSVQRMSGVNTQPIDITNRSASFEMDVGYVVPSDVTVDGPATVHVAVTIEPQQISRTVEVGLIPTGARAGLMYQLSRPSVLVTLAGSAPDLDALTPEQLAATVDVSSLGVGSFQAQVQVTAPAGIAVVNVEPGQVQVDVTQPPPPSPVTGSPSPGASPVAPSPSPSPSPSPAPGGGA